jgi:hypothetical protein
MTEISNSFAAASTRAVVTIGGGVGSEPSAPDDKLLAALPPAKRILELGRPDSQVGAAYCERHPQAQWFLADADPMTLESIAGPFDLLVLSNGLPPLAMLDMANAKVSPGATLIAAIDNAASWSALAQIIEADVDSVDAPLSPSAAYKRLLDAGWMPTLADQHPAMPPAASLVEASAPLADALGVPRRTADRTLSMARVIVQAVRGFDHAPRHAAQALFSVVVPTTRETQLRANVERSPGLHEVRAQVISYRGASSPAEALAQSLAHCDSDWVLFCHQDVYFPRGFGEQLNAVLAAVPAEARASALFGFIGMGLNRTTLACEPAGFVIDRLHRADHVHSDTALSIDELAIVVARESIHRIDPTLGWHLWATDLCLTAVCTHGVFPRIVRLPLFHNSSNDYVLPAAFHDAAASLRRKYPDFGPIHTLCGTIDDALPGQADTEDPAFPPAMNAVVTAAPDKPQQRSNSRLELLVDDVDQAVTAHLATKDYPNAMRSIAAGVHHSYRRPEFERAALYYPQLDRHLEQLAHLLHTEMQAAGKLRQASGNRRGALIIATELYELGGHSRVVEDISREFDRAFVVLTDLFDTYERQPEMVDLLTERFKHCTLVVVPAGSSWAKAENLRRLADAMEPSDIFYLGHHQDPIPFVATLSIPQTRKLLIHHGDHNPSLGCTLADVVHVDVSEGVREVCAAHLSQPTHLLPLYVSDLGVKIFPALQARAFSVVTSGHPAKFSRGGPLALQSLVQASLSTVQGVHHHIGPIDDAWVSEIRAHLRAHGIDPTRFVHHGLVPSLWTTLKGLDAAVYIGSAPIGGGRAAIEAQGCGYPVMYFGGSEAAGTAGNERLYANRELKWSNTSELAQRLDLIGPAHGAQSSRARQLYLDQHSRAPFQSAITRLLAPLG